MKMALLLWKYIKDKVKNFLMKVKEESKMLP